MIARFNGNVVPFADDATSTNRTVFGGVTQSDAIDDNLNADFKKGWEIVGLNDNPTKEDFNAMGYTLGALTAYLYEMGIAEWNTSQNYRVNSRVIGSDGNLYKSLTGTSGTPNAGNNPLSDVVNWKSLEAVSLTGNQTVDGVKTFTSSPIVPTPTTTGNVITMDNIIQKTAVGIGYGSGSGGTVTQLTSKSTPVTLNKPSGQITMNNASLAAGAIIYFSLNNTLITADDVLIATIKDGSGVDVRLYRVEAISQGSFFSWIKVTNTHSSSLSESIVIKYAIIKGANS